MPNIFNIPASLPFADTLARGIIEKYGTEKLALADITLLLPNRRSCRSVQEAFLRVTGGNPTILPRMQPIGDVGDEDFTFRISLGKIAQNLPPVISSTRQRLLLAQLVEKWQGVKLGKNKISIAQSAHLAVELAKFLDEVQRENLSLDKLSNIVPEDLAQHWQVTLDFMDIIIKNWPEILKERGYIDNGTYRNLALGALAEYWQENPPEHPVIAAGSTGSIPATANLLKIISNMPRGAVILPGLDSAIDNESWKILSETHPQFGLRNLLENIGVERENVAQWQMSTPTDKETARAKLITEIMRPSETSEKWQDTTSISEDAVLGISQITAPTLQDEARIIATIFRDTLETPGKTAALVTVDANLAERTTGMMEKWGIDLDSSAGRPLSEVPSCVFMRLLAHMAEEKISPVTMLACLKHPMARAGGETGVFKSNIREIEKEVLRGLRLDGGISGIKTTLEEKNKYALSAWLGEIENILMPFTNLMRKKYAKFSELVESHIKISEDLAATSDANGSEHLWGSDDGTALQEFFDELIEASVEIGNIEPAQYLGVLEALLAGKIYRPKYGSHPRLAVLSPMEARMQGFDIVILGGLNEDSWPGVVESGPWMSRPMRKNFGLPLPERKIGQAAHDFAMLMHAKNVILTRSDKVDGTATIASRWLMRLDAYIGILKMDNLLKPEKPWDKWAEQFNKIDDVVPCAPPKPKPPAHVRPQEISATGVEKLMRDPYAYYAGKILHLKKLDPIDMEPSQRDFGDIVHKIIEGFVNGYDAIPENGRLECLVDSWKNLLEKKHIPVSVQAFWNPRFSNIAAELVEKEAQRRKTLSKVLAETKGAYKIILDNGTEFTITARADRVEQSHLGEITIVDYKTKSKIDSIKNGIMNGTLPQMPIEALIANHDGFENISGTVEDMEYWYLTGGNDTKNAIGADKISAKLGKENTVEEVLKTTETGLALLANTFINHSTPYLACPDPEKEPDYNDFGHLARKSEW